MHQSSLAFMPSKVRPNLVLSFMTGLAFIADVASLYQFISNWSHAQFWSQQWFINLTFVLVLLGITIGLSYLANNQERPLTLLGIYGYGYILISIVLYISWGALQTLTILSIYDYLAYMSLFGIATITGLICIKFLDEPGLVRVVSYFFGFFNLTFLLLLVDRYVFETTCLKLTALYLEWNISIKAFQGIVWDVLIGEIVVFIIGATLFLWLYFKTHKASYTSGMKYEKENSQKSGTTSQMKAQADFKIRSR